MSMIYLEIKVTIYPPKTTMLLKAYRFPIMLSEAYEFPTMFLKTDGFSIMLPGVDWCPNMFVSLWATRCVLG